MLQMNADVLVVGAGAIGLTIARAVARAGGAVTVVDPAEPGSGATRAASSRTSCMAWLPATNCPAAACRFTRSRRRFS